MSRIRIISGTYGGLTIKTVSGSSTRPTTDRVREAWGSTLNSLLPDGFAGQRVLDAFAGSGALGIEALSRGAASTIFCENNQGALQTLRSNISSLSLQPSQAKVLACDTFSPRALAQLTDLGPFNMVFLDPPYATEPQQVGRLLNTLGEAHILAENCLISYEHSKESAKTKKGEKPRDTSTTLKDLLSERFQLVSNKIYGLTEIEYFIYH
jgi:16S rRNA (guanine966-N2)-methyltransferase